MATTIEKTYGMIEILDPIKELDIIKGYDFNSAHAFVWYYNKIELLDATTWLSNLNIEIFENLIRVRIFDKEKELHIWRSNSELKARFIIDTENSIVTNETDKDWVDAKLPLIGSIDITEDGSLFLFSAKDQFKLSIPKSLSKLKTGNVYIRTRNYIDYNSIGQAGFVDTRFVEISSIN